MLKCIVMYVLGMYVLGACVYICIHWYVLMNAYMVDNDTSSNMIFIL